MKSRQYSFERLHVWEDTRELIKRVYSITSPFPEFETYCLVNQMRRAAISISSTRAEGSSRTSAKDQAHFFQFAYPGLMGIPCQFITSYDLGYITEEKHLGLRKTIQLISFRIYALRNNRLNLPKSI